MTGKEVCRYIDLVDRRVFIISHAGVDWKPEYAVELEAIDMELAELRRKVDQEHGRKQEERKEEMKQPIIAIPRASELVINALIRKGILVVTESGIRCKENVPAADRESE